MSKFCVSDFSNNGRQTTSTLYEKKATIRDLLWLTVVVGLTVGWAASGRRIAALEARHKNIEAWVRNLQSELWTVEQHLRQEIQVVGAATEFQRGLAGGSFAPLPSPSIPPATIPTLGKTVTSSPSPPIQVPSTDGQPAAQPYVMSSRLNGSLDDMEQWIYVYSDGRVEYEWKKASSAAAKK